MLRKLSLKVSGLVGSTFLSDSVVTHDREFAAQDIPGRFSLPEALDPVRGALVSQRTVTSADLRLVISYLKKYCLTSWKIMASTICL